MMNFKAAKLILANGRIFNGVAPTTQKTTTFGEIVFNIASTGYEEILTDPSYSGKVIVFTSPTIGNYGVVDSVNFESDKIQVQAIICQTLADVPSHPQMITLIHWLEKQNIPLILGIDTRELAKEIRECGSQDCALIFDNSGKPRSFGNALAIHWVKQVSIKEPKEYGNGQHKIILVDCGVKQNVIRKLLKFDIRLKLVPFDYDYSEEDFAGVFLSNGPGDPKLCKDTIKILERAMRHGKPIYGICLGSLIMALASGASYYKLQSGHYGPSQPCMEQKSSKCYMVNQSQGYSIDEATLSEDWFVSFRHLNDNTVMGISHKFLPFAAVLFHPESAPGPMDTAYFFEQFIDLLK